MDARIAYPFFTALLTSLWLTPLSARLSNRLGAVDRPDQRKVHGRVVPRMGGLAIVAGVALAAAVFLPSTRPVLALLLGLAVAAAVGFVDDLRGLSPAAKFAGQTVAAAAFVLVGGYEIRTLGDLLGSGPLPTGGFAPFFTVLCMVGMMNALNLSDGLDGLAGGICATACVFLGMFAYASGDRLALTVLAALFGGVLGFLRYNSYPATLFMGDTGSLILGYVLSAVGVLMAGEGTGTVSPVSVGIVLALPAFDTLLVMARRIAHGRHPFWPDRSHLHHRLMDLGLPHEAVVPILYLCTAAFGLLAWTSRDWPDMLRYASTFGLGLLVYGTVVAAQHARRRWSRDARRSAAGSPHGKGFHSLAAWVGRSTPSVLRVLFAGLLLPVAFVGPVTRTAGIAALAVALLLGVLFPWRSRTSSSSICYGLTYAALACFLAALHFARPVPDWLDAYFVSLSGITLVWVFLKAKFKGRHKVFFASGFEILVFGTTWFIPVVLVPALGLPESTRSLFFLVCIEATVFQMAFKILIRKRPSRNLLVAGGLLAVLLFLGVRSFLGGGGESVPSAGERLSVTIFKISSIISASDTKL